VRLLRGGLRAPNSGLIRSTARRPFFLNTVHLSFELTCRCGHEDPLTDGDEVPSFATRLLQRRISFVCCPVAPSLPIFLVYPFFHYVAVSAMNIERKMQQHFLSIVCMICDIFSVLSCAFIFLLSEVQR